jgi:hypothetical protein
MHWKHALLLPLLAVAGYVLAEPFEPVCPPCQPIGETEDGVFIARTRKTPAPLPQSHWFLTAFTQDDYGKLSHIDVLYQADCTKRQAKPIEMHLFDNSDQELPKDKAYAPAIDKLHYSPKVQAIVVDFICPSN